MSNIEELIKKISQKAGLSRAEIKKRIEEKQKELGFFVNDIAAAHIIAKDLNVSLGRPELKKRPKLTIESLKKMEPGLSGVGLTAIILRVYHPIEYVREGTKGILAPILLHDGTDTIRTILWGTMARHITDKQIERGSVIKIKQGYTKMGRNQELELHIGDRGLIELDTETETNDFPNPENEILDLDAFDEEMQEIDVKATVLRVGKLTTFNRSDGTEGRVSNLFLKGIKTPNKDYHLSFNLNLEKETHGINEALCDSLKCLNNKGNFNQTPIIVITNEFNWNNKLLNNVIEWAFKYGTPVFIKSRYDSDEYLDLPLRQGGYLGEKTGNGRIGSVTINLPRLGFNAKDEDEFFELLNELTWLASSSLEEKRIYLEKSGLKSIENFFSVISIIGVHETLINLINCGIADSPGKAVTYKILESLRKTIQEINYCTGHPYSLETTPSMLCSCRLALIDKKKYPKYDPGFRSDFHASSPH